MPWAGFKATIPVSERSVAVYALYDVVTDRSRRLLILKTHFIVILIVQTLSHLYPDFKDDEPRNTVQILAVERKRVYCFRYTLLTDVNTWWWRSRKTTPQPSISWHTAFALWVITVQSAYTVGCIFHSIQYHRQVNTFSEKRAYTQ
jgi:hypothetical protein